MDEAVFRKKNGKRTVEQIDELLRVNELEQMERLRRLRARIKAETMAAETIVNAHREEENESEEDDEHRADVDEYRSAGPGGPGVARHVAQRTTPDGGGPACR